MASKLQFRRAALLSVASIALTTGSTFAQAQSADVEEVVVTGTLIRGIAPIGSTVVGISREAIDASGVMDANALLGQLVPQSNFFLSNPQPGENNPLGIARVPLNKPNLRDLPNTNTGSGAPTLVLMDGHRVVPAGVDFSLAVDVGAFPTGGIERVETILDGASAVYGSDAIGGVINYITKKRFDETRVNATYGFADGYWSTSADVTSGKTWDTGGIGFTYSFSKNSFLYNRERDFTAPRNYLQGGHLTGLACDTYNTVTVAGGGPTTTGGSRRFVVSGTTTPTFTEGAQYCASNAHSTLYPQIGRHAGQVVFSQDLSDVVKLDVTGFYTHRETTQDLGPFVGSVPVTSRNPYFTPIPGVAATTHTVSINYGPVLGYEGLQLAKTNYEIGQVNSTLTVDIGTWQVRGMFAYGKSKVSVDQFLINTTQQSNYITGVAGTTGVFPITSAINPYIPAATTNRALFGDLGYHSLRDGKTTFLEGQIIADGPLFSIPGGEVRGAFGGEWSKTTLSRRVTSGATRLLGPYASASAINKSVFGELNVPIVGPSNSRPGIESLQLSVSGRYDSYVDIGDTFNPKIALTYDPVDWLTLRGNWSKSFRAPNAIDKLGTSGNSLGCIAASLLPPCSTVNVQLPPDYTAPTGTSNVWFNLSGTSPNVKPERSTNWSVGADIRPIEGLTISPSYFQIDFTDYLSSPSQGNLQPIFADARQLVLFCINPDGSRRNGGVGCTAAEIAEFAAKAPANGAANVATAQAAGYNILYFLDSTVTNLGGVLIKGLDLNTRYTRPTSFGSIDANINATWKLKNDQAIFAGGPVTPLLATGISRFRLAATVGVNIGEFRAQATLQHQAGFLPSPTATFCPCQTTIDQFDVLNMSFRYNVNGTGLLQDLSLSLTVNNVFDSNPPVSRTGSLTADTTGGSVAQGADQNPFSTLGRFVQFGISKKF